MKEILYLDMDGVLVDFHTSVKNWFEVHPGRVNQYKGYVDSIPGVFLDAPPIDGAIEAVKELDKSNQFDIFIATASPWNNPEAATHKRYWLERHFGNMFKHKLFITHRKDLLIGDFLIDDRTKNGAGQFKGELIKFGYNFDEKKWNDYKDWNSTLEYLLPLSTKFQIGGSALI